MAFMNIAEIKLDSTHGVAIHFFFKFGFRQPSVNIDDNDVEADSDQPYSWEQIEELNYNLFNNFYYCGDFIENPEGNSPSVEFLFSNDSGYEDNVLKVNRNDPNILVFTHEMIHALKHLNAGISNYGEHDSSDLLDNCESLNIKFEGSPGLLLDYYTLLRINNFSNFLISFLSPEDISKHLPDVYMVYPKSNEFCEKFSEGTYDVVNDNLAELISLFIDYLNLPILVNLVDNNTDDTAKSINKLSTSSKIFKQILHGFLIKFEEEKDFIDENLLIKSKKLPPNYARNNADYLLDKFSNNIKKDTKLLERIGIEKLELFNTLGKDYINNNSKDK